MEQVVTTPVVIPEGARSFVANGRTYHKAEGLSMRRYLWYQRLSVELATGMGVSDLHAKTREAFDLINKLKFAEASVALHEGLAGYADINEDRYPAAMRMTLLFWNAEGEDIADMSEEIMAKKITDMEEAGIDASFFFVQALTSVHGLVSAYVERSKGYSPTKRPERGTPSGEGSPAPTSPSTSRNASKN